MCERERVNGEREIPPPPAAGNTDEQGRWTEVQRRQWKLLPKITSYFVYNLPQTLTNLELKKLYQHLPGLRDAYIPKKKDKYGNLFGFIRFQNLTNPHTLLPLLQNVKANGMILSVHMAKNDRNGKPFPNNQPPPPQNRPPPPPPPFHSHQSSIPKPFHSTSYRDKLLDSHPPPSITAADLTKTKPNATNSWKNSSIIAMVKDIETLLNPKPLLQDPEFTTNITVSYVGGLFVLLSFEAPSFAKFFMQSKRAFLQKWFHSAEIWSGQDIVSGRVVRIKIHGMPLPLWGKESFDKVAASLGKLLISSEANSSDKKISTGSATILVDSHKRIDGMVRLVNGNKTFLVRVMEDHSEWSPPFFDDDYSESDSDEEPDDLENFSGNVDGEIPMDTNQSDDPLDPLVKDPNLEIPTDPTLETPPNTTFTSQLITDVPLPQNSQTPHLDPGKNDYYLAHTIPTPMQIPNQPHLKENPMHSQNPRQNPYFNPPSTQPIPSSPSTPFKKINEPPNLGTSRKRPRRFPPPPNKS